MNFESILPFAIILSLFALAFLTEALVLFFFKVTTFWKAIGGSFLANTISIVLVYFICVFIFSKIGYEANVLRLQLPAIFFLCWLSIITDGLLLQVIFKKADKKKIYTASICMNILSYLFLCFFIDNSH